jgi:hypothetical protein
MNDELHEVQREMGFREAQEAARDSVHEHDYFTNTDSSRKQERGAKAVGPAPRSYIGQAFVLSVVYFDSRSVTRAACERFPNLSTQKRRPTVPRRCFNGRETRVPHPNCARDPHRPRPYLLGNGQVPGTRRRSPAPDTPFSPCTTPPLAAFVLRRIPSTGSAQDRGSLNANGLLRDPSARWCLRPLASSPPPRSAAIPIDARHASPIH